MLREIDLKEISDGKLYGPNDLVKAGCNDCAGCFSCCQGMGESVILDPLDIFHLTEGLHRTFEELLAKNIALRVVDGLILPYLPMTGAEETCTFLNAEGRCSIHAFRPGFCRLFPLGRVYDDNGFQYFLQIHECRYKNPTKVKVKKWIDMPQFGRYEQFVKEWHFLQKDLQKKLNEQDDPEFRKKVCMLFLQNFYQKPYAGADFYAEFENRRTDFLKMLSF